MFHLKRCCYSLWINPPPIYSELTLTIKDESSKTSMEWFLAWEPTQPPGPTDIQVISYTYNLNMILAHCRNMVWSNETYNILCIRDWQKSAMLTFRVSYPGWKQIILNYDLFCFIHVTNLWMPIGRINVLWTQPQPLLQDLAYSWLTSFVSSWVTGYRSLSANSTSQNT